MSTLCNVNLCLHAFKISSNMVKNNIQIRQVNDVHRYRTRTRENFVTPNYQTHLSNQDFYVRAFNLFNSLPPLVKNNEE